MVRLLKCIDDIKNTVADTGSQIIDPDTALLFGQLVQCLYMAVCQVYHVNVITDTGSVRSVIVIAEYAQAYQLANCHLCNVRKQVVRDTLRILTDTAGLMSSDRVKVAKQHYLPFRIRSVKVG